MKNNRFLKSAIVFGVAVIICALAGFMFAVDGSIDANPVLLTFTIMAVGTGLIFTFYGILTKGGYETGVGTVLLIVGVTLILIKSLKWYVVLVIDIALLGIAFLALLLMKIDTLNVKRTDEEKGYVPYMEKLEKEKAKEERHADKLPKLKDYSNKKK